MSLKSWKEEFYPKAASRVSRAGALKHSIRKWEGTRASELKKHNVTFVGNAVLEYDKAAHRHHWLIFNGETCALCRHWFKLSSCAGCPLYESRGRVRCDEAAPGEGLNPYDTAACGNVGPMITALKKAEAWVTQQSEEEPKNKNDDHGTN